MKMSESEDISNQLYPQKSPVWDVFEVMSQTIVGLEVSTTLDEFGSSF